MERSMPQLIILSLGALAAVPMTQVIFGTTMTVGARIRKSVLGPILKCGAQVQLEPHTN